MPSHQCSSFSNIRCPHCGMMSVEVENPVSTCFCRAPSKAPDGARYIQTGELRRNRFWGVTATSPS